MSQLLPRFEQSLLDIPIRLDELKKRVVGSEKIMLVISDRAIDILDASERIAKILATTRKNEEFRMPSISSNTMEDMYFSDKIVGAYHLDHLDETTRNAMQNIVGSFQHLPENDYEVYFQLRKGIQETREILSYKHFSQPALRNNFHQFFIDKELFPDYHKWWNHPLVVAFEGKYPELYHELVQRNTRNYKTPLNAEEFEEFLGRLYQAYCLMMSHEIQPTNGDLFR